MSNRGKNIAIILLFISLWGYAFADDGIPHLKCSDKKYHFETKKHVLVLNSYHEGYLWTDRIMQGVKSTFNDYCNVRLYINYMDTKVYADSLYFSKYAELLDLKYVNISFDAVLATDDHALDFMLQYQDSLFPDVPVVFCGINDFTTGKLGDKTNFTGILEQYDEAGTINLIKRNHPETKNIIVVSDDTYTGELFVRRIRRVENQFTDDISFTYLQHLSPEEVKIKLSSAPDNSAIIWASYVRSPQGETFTYQEGVSLVTDNTDFPVYCLWDVVGTGVVGGKITSPVFQGIRSSEYVIDIMKGQDPANIEISPCPLIYKFDYPQLERYDIEVKSLPENRIIINEPFSVFQTYKREIISVTVVIILLIIIITVLFVLNRRMVKAENELLKKNFELQRKTKLLADTNIKLEAASNKAQESDRLKTTFLANLSHEIRTPMNGILGFTTLLKKDNVPTEKQKKYINVIEQSGIRMLSLINDLIDISKIESGQVKFHKTEVNIINLCEELYDFFVPVAKENNLQLEYSPDKNCTECKVVTDKVKLEQVLVNIIKNALKFTKEGTVNFGFLKEKEELTFFIEDTGPGVPKKYQEMIFERFRQIDESTKREEQGSGLGLPISKAYVEMMGGTIFVESEVGKGSRFVFTIKNLRQ